MSENQELESQQNLLTSISQKYIPYNEIIDTQLSSELQSIVKTFKSDAENALEKDRLLRIGVVGQIKRGKSTFLNALFFDGDDILPKAITPMTASLTAIKYAEKSRAVIEYYSEADWVTVIKKAKEYDRLKQEDEYAVPPEDVEASHELFTKAAEIDNIEQYFGKRQKLENFESLNAMVGKLDQFVGSEGELSPLVRNTELYVNIPALKDIEVVDTPGLNDPILSRAAITKEYMGKCDVVFLLSSCSQFLPIGDMQLLRQNIPSKGIKDIVLVGSRFDNSMLESYDEYKDAVSLIEDLQEKFTREADRNIKSVTEDNESSQAIVETLENAMPPLFISAMCFNIAKHYDDMSESEKKIFDKLNNMYGDTFEKEDLLDIANLNTAQDKLDEFRQNKDRILTERFNELLRANKDALRTHLLSIQKQVSSAFEKFQSEDLANIEKQQKTGIKNLQNGTNRVNGVFDTHIFKAEKNFSELKREVKADGRRARKLNSHDGSETKNYEVSTSKWYNPFSWGSSKTVTQTINYKYANIHDAIEQLEDFVYHEEEQIEAGITEIINIRTFRGELITNINEMFDVEDDSFNQNDVMMPVENAVNRITIPDVNLDVRKHISTVRDNFKGMEVRNDDIEKLRSAQASVIETISKDINKEITGIVENITLKLTEIRDTFIPQLTKDMEETVDRLRKQLADKKRYQKEYEAVLVLLEKDLAE